MTESYGGKVQETQIGRYKSTRGINYDSVPWKLWEKSKKLFWDPADQSPEAMLDATLVYNQLVEGVAAINGYRRWDETFRKIGKLPGLEAGLKLTQRDERRHIAYGTYLGRQILAEHPELWEFVERRWERFTRGFVGSYGSVVQQRGNTADFDPVALKALMDRRLEALRVAVTMRLEDVEQADSGSFVPEELALMT